MFPLCSAARSTQIHMSVRPRFILDEIVTVFKVRGAITDSQRWARVCTTFVLSDGSPDVSMSAHKRRFLPISQSEFIHVNNEH